MLARLTLFALTLLAAFTISLAPAHAAEPIGGRWITAEKDAVVAIKPCGRAICGSIERFIVPPPEGKDQRDINNPDPALRQRKLLGLTILSSLKADGEVWRGEVYDPKTGKSYRTEVRRKGPDALEVKGCVGPFCQTQTWRKAT